MAEESNRDRGTMRGGGANIGTGRRKLAAIIGDRVVDPGLATPEMSHVTSHGMVPVKHPEHASRETPVVVEDAAIAEFFQKPQSAAEVERRFGLRRGYLGQALRRRYHDVASLKRALQGSLLESSLVLVEHAMLNIEEMTPAQAMLGAKIAVDASVTIERSIREAPKTIDFGQLAEIGVGLARLQAYVTGDTTGATGGITGLEIRSDDEEIRRED